MKNFLLIILFMFFIGCSNFIECNNDTDINYIVRNHELKLKRHFLSIKRQDISSLITETVGISSNLKKAGKYDVANKFDSYVDVLTYGKYTIPESLHDVKCLIKNPDISSINSPDKNTKCCIIFPF